MRAIRFAVALAARVAPSAIDGSPAVFTGLANYAIGQIVRQYGGAGLLATEMVSARGFAWLDEAEHPDRLWGVRDTIRWTCRVRVEMWRFFGAIRPGGTG